MIEFDGIAFNESISRRIMSALADHDCSFADLAQDQVANRVTRYSFMAAVAQIRSQRHPDTGAWSWRRRRRR